MHRTALPRLLAAVFVMLVVVVVFIELGRNREEARPSSPPQQAESDSLRSELQRCQALGEAAVHDYACLDAWADNRRRFLGTDSESRRSE